VIYRLVCGGCGASPSGPLPFRCPSYGSGDVDHVLARQGLPAAVELDDDPNPFIRFRRLTYPWASAAAGGISDGDYVGLVRQFDAAVEAVDGRGFRVTPLLRRDELYIKDETGNVSGSHKGRHLMGIALQLEVAARLGHAVEAPLAIASCGNAALAAAVVARAARRPLRVFVPESANPTVMERLRALGAELTVCPRRPGVAGDPSYLAFREAVDAGAVPFTCQGGDNGLTLDGGRTLGYELAQQLAGAALDQCVIQVGGGALASSTICALREAVALGWLPRLPRIYTVQTRGAFPLQRAWERLSSVAGTTDEKLRWAATHRASFMWPWESEPRSVAHGILDDETYDWLALVRGMLESGGEPLVVDEPLLLEANAWGRSLGIDVDATGSAGLAGAMALGGGGTTAVIFSGVKR
jgi:threonine synthase